jgi:hypothetical protein
MKLIIPAFLTASFFISGNFYIEKPAQINTIISPDQDQMNIFVADTSPVKKSRLIRPGKSIGLTSINQKDNIVNKNLGPSSTSEAGMGGKELATWYSKPVIRGKDTVINEIEIYFTMRMGEKPEPKKVRHIRITSGFFVTVNHIGTGSGQDSIKKYFPAMISVGTYTSPKTKKQVTIYDDKHAGIAFEIDDQKKCIGITVHEPDEPAYETYNSLFSDVNFF